MSYELKPRMVGDGNWILGTAGEDLTAHQLVYLNGSTQWILADADALVTMPVVGMAQHDIISGQKGVIFLYGFIGDSSWTWTPGGDVYASTVAGGLTQTSPSGSGDIVQRVGIAYNATMIYFQPVFTPGSVSNTLEGYTAYVGFDSGKDYLVNYWYVDGTADDVQINAALTYTNGFGGGCVFLETGTFTLADPVSFPGNDLKLHGCGVSTMLDGDGLATTEHAIVISGRTHCTVSNLSVQTQGGGTKTCQAIFIEDGSNDFHILHVSIPDSDDNGIHIEGTTISRGHISNCHITGTDGHGIYVNMDGGNFMGQLHIFDNSIINVGNAGIYFDASGGNNYCIVEGNTIASPAGIGIYGDDLDQAQILGNICILAGLSGIHIVGSNDVNITDNICNASERHGIFLTGSTDDSLIDGNICNDNDSGDTGTYDGISIDGSACTNNTIINNTCLRNHGNGIYTVGIANQVNTNLVAENDLHGIQFSGGDCQVNSNHVADNSQDAAGTYHGIHVMGSADRAVVIGNHINGYGDSQEDGIQLSNGATEVIIIGNLCQDGMGSGITLSANNDDCTILGNYLFENDDYGIELAGTSDNNRVRDNTFNGNVTGAVLDGGTNNIFHTKQYYVARDDDNVNQTPGKSITNGQTAYIAVHATAGLQQIMGFNIYVIPNVTQAAADWDLATSYGAIGEANNTHTEAEAAATYNVTNLEWFEIDAWAAGMFASMVEEDTGGISVTVSTATHNVTVVMAEMYYV